MPFVQIDIEQVRSRVVMAERRVEQARSLRMHAEAEEKAALDDLALAKRVEETILQAVVPLSGADIEEVRPTFLEVAVGSLTTMPTRKAVLWALRHEPGRVWALDELFSFMQSEGFQGTQNAVHVQLSRLIGTDEGFDIQRVKTGFYRAIPPEEMLLNRVLNPNLDGEAENSGQGALAG